MHRGTTTRGHVYIPRNGARGGPRPADTFTLDSSLRDVRGEGLLVIPGLMLSLPSAPADEHSHPKPSPPGWTGTYAEPPAHLLNG